MFIFLFFIQNSLSFSNGKCHISHDVNDKLNGFISGRVKNLEHDGNYPESTLSAVDVIPFKKLRRKQRGRTDPR